MPLRTEVHVAGSAVLGDYDLIAIPVAKSSSGIAPLESAGAGLSSLELTVEMDAAFFERHKFEASSGQSLVFSKSPGQPTVLLVGMGSDPTTEQWRQAGALSTRATKGPRGLLLVSPEGSESAALGAALSSYRYSLKSSDESAFPERLDLLGANEAAVTTGRVIAETVSAARDFVNRVPSELTPTRLADDAAALLAGAPSVEVEIWDQSRIELERLGGLLGVAKGSVQPPRLVRATYTPSEESTGHVVLVGKGITFDSGGLSLKTAQGMTTMKTDMTGAAVVLSAMSALADLGVTAKVTAIAPMAENMPSGSAMRPGDVLTPRSGTTIEVLNTDAEGRLILADGLTLAAETSPDVIIDVATLTGAAVVALGTGMGALFSNSDEVASAFDAAAQRSGEKFWRLPLVPEYESHIKSEIADIKNVGAAGEAGTISAALFLQRFVDATPWVHLDIAGPGRSEKDAGYLSKGGTAFSLMAILDYLRSYSS